MNSLSDSRGNNMATDEEIHKFVNDNRELVERMMAVQKENAEMAKAM